MSLTVKRKPKIHSFSGDVNTFFKGFKVIVDGVERFKNIVDGDTMEEISDPDQQHYNSYQIIKQTDGSFTYKQRNSGIDTMSITFTLDDNTAVATYFKFLKDNNIVYSGDKIVVEAEAQGAHKEYIIIHDGEPSELRCALRKDDDDIQAITFTFFEKSDYSPKDQLYHLEGIAEEGDTMEYIGYHGNLTFDIITGPDGKLTLKLKKKRKIGKSSKSSTSSGSSSSGKGSSSSSSSHKKKKGRGGGKRRRTRKGSK